MIERPYSQRKTPLDPKDRGELSKDFRISLQEVLRGFIRDEYLCEHFGKNCSYGEVHFFEPRRLQYKIRERLGGVSFPDPRTSIEGLEQDNVFDVIELLYEFVSFPIQRAGNCPYACLGIIWHRYDNQIGRREYEEKINEAFDRFAHPYRIVEGRVRRIDSPILEAPLIEMELRTDDDHLRKLIETAIDDFTYRSGGRKKQALQSIVDAFDRLKTLEHDDKKKSTAKTLERITVIEAVRDSLGKDMKELTDISNDFCIRHHSHSNKPIDDEDIIDHLFYMYFNFVRLILTKYDLLVQGTAKPSQTD